MYSGRSAFPRVAFCASLFLLASCASLDEYGHGSSPIVAEPGPREAALIAPVGPRWATISNGVAVLPHTDTQHVLDRSLFALPAQPRLGAVASRLTDALEAAKYGSRYKFYEVPGGFVLVTALEQVASNGEFLPDPDDRWSLGFPSIDLLSVPQVTRALFLAPKGHYRLIMFVVAAEIESSAAEPTHAETEVWLREGRLVLPDHLADLPLTASHEVYALVYQFRRIGHYSEAEPNSDGAPDAIVHLERSGILAALHQ